MDAIDLTLNNAMTSVKKRGVLIGGRSRVVLDLLHCPDDILHELIDVIGPTVGQLSLGQRPDSFIGVEFRGIGGKVFDGETWMLTQELPEGFSLVGGGIIQQHNDRAA